MRANGEVRYIGITTSHGRRHREFAQIMEREPLDFVQEVSDESEEETGKKGMATCFSHLHKEQRQGFSLDLSIVLANSVVGPEM